MEEGWEPLTIGCGETLRQGDDLLIVAYGSMVSRAATADLLSQKGVQATVVNARFLRPLDQALIHPLARRIGKVVTWKREHWLVVWSAVLESFNDHDVMVPLFRLGIPDQLVDHATPQQSFDVLGLTPEQMQVRISERFGFDRVHETINQSPQTLVQS